MKSIIWITISVLFLTTCKQPVKSNQSYEEYHTELHKEMDKVSAEYKKFEQQLSDLYLQSETEPKRTLIKIDSLIDVAKNEKDPIKSQNSSHIISSLLYFKAEIYYNTGNYQKSISNIYKSNYMYKSIHTGDATAIAANYIKLGEIELAKSFIDSIGKGYYIYDYALGNYYESVGNKLEALSIYNEIKKDKRRHQHYFYYKPVIDRINDIIQNNHLIKNIHFPTGHPYFDITLDDKEDDENRTKILNEINEFPEAQGYMVYIYQGPLIDETDYYWIKVGKGNNFEDENFATYNFYVYTKPYEIKFFDPKTKNILTLAEWRKK